MWRPLLLLATLCSASKLTSAESAANGTDASGLGADATSVPIASTSEELHAALADPNVTEVLVASRLQISPPVFSSSPGRKLRLDREVRIRGISPEAGLWAALEDDAGSSSSLDYGWMEFATYLELVSLRLDNLIVFNRTNFISRGRFVGHGALLHIRGARRLSAGVLADGEATAIGRLSIRNCSIQIGLGDVDYEAVWAPLNNFYRSLMVENAFAHAGTSTGIMPTGLQNNSWLVPVLSPSEASQAALDVLRLMLKLGFHTAYGGDTFDTAYAHLSVWGPSKLHLLWYLSYTFRVVDSSFALTNAAATAISNNLLEFAYPGNYSNAADMMESFRTEMLTYSGEKNTECQSIYAEDTALLTAAARAGAGLPPSFTRRVGGRDYQGAMNHTASGRPCVPWRDVKHHGAEEEFWDLEGNACRNPSAYPGQRGVWCFVDSVTDTYRVAGWGPSSLDQWRGGRDAWARYEWEYCDVPLCGAEEESEEPLSCVTRDEKINGVDGGSRPGPWNVTVTKDGEECRTWSDLNPFQSLYGRFDDNMCRTTETLLQGVDIALKGPWCFAGTMLLPTACDVSALEVCPEAEGAATATSGSNETKDGNSTAGNPDDVLPADDNSMLMIGATVGSLAFATAVSVIAAVYAIRRYRASGSGAPDGKDLHDMEESTLSLRKDDERRNERSSDDPGKAAEASGSSHRTNDSAAASLRKSKRSSWAGHSVRVLAQPPDELGIIQLHGCIGTGISSRVERCTWQGNAACCKIMVIEQMPQKVAQKVIMGIEANLLVGLCHPHIVQTFQIYHVMKQLNEGTPDNDEAQASSAPERFEENIKEIWIVQEFCGAGSMTKMQDALTAMPNGMAIKLSLARQVLLALNFLHHEVRLVHGDLKPDNILLKRNDENQLVAKLADFGLTHVMAERASYQATTICGDLYYQPPESMFKGMISPAMDIWAVGVTIYETITGGISGVTLKHHLQRVKSGFQADLPAGAPPRLQAFVYKCTAKEPENRPTAGQALEELETIMGEMGIPMKQQLFRPDGGSSMIAKMTPAQYTVVLDRVREVSSQMAQGGGYTIMTKEGSDSRSGGYSKTPDSRSGGYSKTPVMPQKQAVPGQRRHSYISSASSSSSYSAAVLPVMAGGHLNGGGYSHPQQGHGSGEQHGNTRE